MEHKETEKYFDKVLYDVRNILQQDVNKHLDGLEKEDSQFWRRGFVRATFAYIEGLIFSIKVESLIMHQVIQFDRARQEMDLTGVTSFEDFAKAFSEHVAKAFTGAGFSPYELLFLAEVAVDLDEKGQIKARRSKISLEKNLVFAFRIYAQACEIQYKLNKSNQGWQDLKKAIKVRDRLMHPKRVQDLTVSDEELQTVMRAYTWVLQCQQDINEIIDNSKRKNESIQRMESD